MAGENTNDMEMLSENVAALKDYLEAHDFGVVMKLGMTLDGVPGTLRILKSRRDMTDCAYTLDFMFTKICCDTKWPFDRYYRTYDELVEGIKSLSTIKIIGMSESMQAAELEKYTACYKAVYELLGKDIDTCYACFELCYGNKTKCQHNICVQCYVKSVNKSQGTFTCGVCREEEECCADSDN